MTAAAPVHTGPRRWLRRVGLAGAALLAVLLLQWQLGPPLARAQAEKQLTQALGRQVRVGALAFTPWSLELTVRDVEVGPATGAPPGTPPLLRLPSLHVDGDWQSLWQRGPVVAALVLESPELHLARTAEGHYDIDDLLARLAPLPDEKPSAEPLRYALYNLAVRNATLHFDDLPVRHRHTVQALQLTLPFISNLPAQVAVQLQPRLAFLFNGTAFDTGALATPFASTRQARLNFKMAPFNLQPYAAYLPASLPLRLLRGQLQADLALDFTQPQGSAPQVVLRGDLAATDWALATAGDKPQPLLAWRRLGLQLLELRPLARQLALGPLKVEAPELHLARDAQGRLVLPALQPGAAPGSAALAASPSSAPATPEPPADPASAWALKLEALDISDMQLHWADAAVKPAVALALEGVALRTGPWAWPLANGAVPVQVQARLAAPQAQPTPAADAGPGQGRLTLQGQVDAQARSAVVDLKLEALRLQALAPYLAGVMGPQQQGQHQQGQRQPGPPPQAPQLQGQLGLSGQATLNLAGDTPQITLRDGSLRLDELRLDDERMASAKPPPALAKAMPAAGRKPASRVPALSVQQLALGGIQLDLARQRLGVAQVRLVQPQLALRRGADGLWNVQRWAPAGPDTAAAPAPAPQRGAAGAQAWRIDVQDALLDGGQLRFSDEQAPPPSAGQGPAGVPAAGPAASPGAAVAFDLNGLRLALRGLALRAGSAGVSTAAPAQLSLSTKLSAPAGDQHAAVAAGLAWHGQVGLAPLLARGKLKLERFPVHLFEPYFGSQLKLDLARAEMGAEAELQLQDTPTGWRAQASGDALVADVLVNAREADGSRGDALLSWHSLQLKGVDLALLPGQPLRLQVGEAALNDFYSRLVLTEQGRFNLQDVAAADAAAGAGTAAAPADASAGAGAGASAGASASASAAAQGQAGSPGNRPAGEPGPDIQIGATQLNNGRIDFTDRFVRPNYSAALTELNGRLGAFRSGTREMATLELRGRAAGTALLEITGQLNPTADPLALDIRARATDLELAPLSTYAAKYAGYAIERGKLSMDLAYKIAPDGRLDAQNQVILNQLTFGDKIDSPSATKLPVLLAVALLKDRHGVIDINLPVSGSVSDPQFSVGALVWKVLLNLIGRALTAPFSLLAGGAGEDLSQVAFVPGTAIFQPGGTASLDKVAKALTDRPALKMTVTGAADLASEREAYQRAALEARLLQEHRKALSRAGDSVEVVNASTRLTAEERDQALRELYRQTVGPEQARNPVGQAKALAAAELERLLLARTPSNEDTARELALQRGLAVRDALIARGLPSERLFLAAPKLRSPGDGAAAWQPQVNLSLSAN